MMSISACLGPVMPPALNTVPYPAPSSVFLFPVLSALGFVAQRQDQA